jgi:hypothetical protein
MQDIIQQFLEMQKSGQFTGAHWRKQLKTRKGIVSIIEKETKLVCRSGLDYSNQKTVIEQRESGELPKDPQPLPWGRWDIFPYVIEHKGEYYLRFYPPFQAIEVTYFLNGNVCTLDDIREKILASELPKHEIPNCVTVKASNMISVS